MDFNTSWEEGFMNYASDMGKFYQINKPVMLSCLKFKSVLDSLNETYQLLTRENGIERIEDLPAEKKAELWEQAKGIGTEKKQCIMICKAIYLLEKITE